MAQNHSCAIDGDGTMFKSRYGKGETGYHLIQKLSDVGTLTTLLQYGTYDENIDDLDIEYYKIADGVRVIITKEEYFELVELYSPYFSNMKEITQNSGILFLPLLAPPQPPNEYKKCSARKRAFATISFRAGLFFVARG